MKAFLERVEELSQSRKIDKNELFASAVDLFSSKALVWFRSIKNLVNDWNSLVTLLKREFLPSDYDDQLWDEILLQTQRRNESVTIYIAVMEALFNRLSELPSEAKRVKYIKKNVLPQYVTQLVRNRNNT